MMATTTTSNVAANASRQVNEMGNELRSEFERVDRELRAIVQERPIVALLSAVAAGYLIGRLLRRR
jgi:ElaB/YqjD/DUF883 family membrane-anchored ribosome-binding protein